MHFLRIIILLKLFIFTLAFTSFTSVKADKFENTSFLNSFGMPGEIDLPSAINLPDGQFSVSSTAFGGTIRVNFSFQILKISLEPSDMQEFQVLVEIIEVIIGIAALIYIIYLKKKKDFSFNCFRSKRLYRDRPYIQENI